MKNYTYRHVVESNGLFEVHENEYTNSQIDMKKFVESMADIIVSANCGWDGVMYKVMGNDSYHRVYMVLYCNSGGERWIPIDCNSKACNFSVLGENLW